MTVSHKSQVKSVKKLLKLLGYEKERSEVKKLSKEKPGLFQRLFSAIKHYRPVNFQTRLSSIMLLTEKDGALKALLDLEEIRITKEAGLDLHNEVETLKKLNNLSGSFEESIYSLVTSASAETSLNLIGVVEKTIFTGCVFLNNEKKTAHNPVNQDNMDLIKKDLGYRAVFANMICVKKYKTDREKCDFLLHETASFLQLVKEFLGPSQDDVPVWETEKKKKSSPKKKEKSSPSPKKKEKKKKSEKKKDVAEVEAVQEKKRKNLPDFNENEEKQGNEKKLKFLVEEESIAIAPTKLDSFLESEVLVIDRTTSDFNVALDWFYKVAPVSVNI